MGLASVLLPIADNQLEVAGALDRMGCARFVGRAHVVSRKTIRSEISALLDHPERVEAMGALAFGIVDGQGPRRVADAMVGGEGVDRF